MLLGNIKMLLKSLLSGARAARIIALELARISIGKRHSHRAFRQALVERDIPPDVVERLGEQFAEGQNRLTDALRRFSHKGDT